MAKRRLQTSATLIGAYIQRQRIEEVLREKEKEISDKARNLEEANTALKVLLEHRMKEKEGLREEISETVRTLVLPYLDKLKEGRLNMGQKTYLEIIESNLASIGLVDGRRWSSSSQGLTPTEQQVANMIRMGKSTKEIANVLNVSTNAVFAHRQRIREKLGIAHHKVNLQSFLQSLI
ncbi:MAG: LuxR C-terminal-related transcriptional regulator [Proteobacteria bacterium]|nr:LuxR C-terminal-related transcriptional regulator [Pseudomonadota bacterium]MBU1740445.1 LuxR C-terminal-related transcriptional regulator [Pseudomonadota bacterium]